VKFTELNVLGVYVAPISAMMIAAWVATVALRRLASRFGWFRNIWHPALFEFAIYIMVLSSIVLVLAR
jgi:hypothetical protein